jgi:hypothetical protein
VGSGTCHVHNHVDASLACHLLEPGTEGARIEHILSGRGATIADALSLGALGRGHRDLRVAAGGGDHAARAHQLGELDGGEPDASGRRSHQHRLALLQPRTRSEGEVRGAVVAQERGRLGQIGRRRRRWQFEAGPRGRDLLLRVPATTRETKDAVADRKAGLGGALTEFAHLAGALVARYVRRINLLLVLAARLKQLGKIYAGGGNLNLNLALARSSAFAFDVLERLAELLAHGGAVAAGRLAAKPCADAAQHCAGAESAETAEFTRVKLRCATTTCVRYGTVALANVSGRGIV